MTKIAYLALLKDEYSFASKIYNLMGHAYMYWKKPLLAYKCFKKLHDSSLMDHDLETSMYGLKQCGICCNQAKLFPKALKAFKCSL